MVARILLLLAVFVAVAALFAPSQSHSPARAASTASPYKPFAPTLWPAGTKRTYRTSFHSQTSVVLRHTESGTLGGHVDLEGDLAIVSHGAKDGGPLSLSVTWSALRRADVEALDRSLVSGNAAALAPAVVEIEPDGRLVTIGFAPGAAALARMVQRAFVVELAAVIEGGVGSRPDVRTAAGRAEVERANGIFTRTRYVELDAIGPPASLELQSHGKVTLDANGAVATAEHTEHIDAEADDERQVSDLDVATRVELTLLRTDHEAANPAPAVDLELVAATSPSDKQRAASLAQRAAGVSVESVKEDLRLAALFPRTGETAWVWRDSAWLELHADESAALIAYAERELSPFGLAAAIDLVVVAGTTAGQTALLALLERVQARDDGIFEMTVQHVEHLRAPRPEIFAFVTRAYAAAGDANAPSQRRVACAYSLGALARRSLEQRAKSASTNGDRPKCANGGDCSADEAVARLEHDLAAVTTERGRIALLRALGNAGQSASFASVAPHRRAAEVDVRRASAAAMRNMEGGLVVDALLELAADPDGGVAAEAFESLFRKQLDDADFGAIERLVQEGRVHEEAHAALIDGLVVNRDAHPAATAILVTLLSSSQASARNKAKIENILRRG